MIPGPSLLTGTSRVPKKPDSDVARVCDWRYPGALKPDRLPDPRHASKLDNNYVHENATMGFVFRVCPTPTYPAGESYSVYFCIVRRPNLRNGSHVCRERTHAVPDRAI
jgi:hypothetical protein